MPFSMMARKSNDANAGTRHAKIPTTGLSASKFCFKPRPVGCQLVPVGCTDDDEVFFDADAKEGVIQQMQKLYDRYAA